MSIIGSHAHLRPELFDLISGRSRYSFDAKIKNIPFDNDKYTQMVLEKIMQASDTDLSYTESEYGGFGYLHLAVQDHEPVFVQALLDRGLDVNADAKKGGGTPLHIALSRYRSDEKSETIVKILLENGADHNIDFDGMPIKEFAKLAGASKFFDD